MRASVLHQFGDDPIIEEVTLSDLLPNEVRLRTTASGVCHTDRTMQNGANALPLPLILGHEVSGVVEAVGEGVTYVKPGDRVATSVSSFCGYCRWCQQGEPQHCENKGRARGPGKPSRATLAGEHVEQFVGLGGFAEELLVHERTLVKIPDEMPLMQAALLGCAGVTGLGAIRHAAKVQAGQTVAIIGCGGVGLNAIQGARLAGASRIIAIDRLPEKLELAKRFGATDVINAAEVDSVEAVRDLTNGGVDHAIEVVGIAPTIEQAFAMLDTRGTATVIGVAHPDLKVQIPAAELLLEKRLQGTKTGSTRFRLDIPLYCDLYLQGRLNLDDLIGETISLDDVPRALADLDKGTSARSIVTFD